MKKFIENFGKLTVALALIFAISCNSNDVDDVIDDIINEGPSLDDGYYIIGSAVSADTTDANKLAAAKVSAPSFGSQDRAGFFETFVYMGSGSFSFIKVNGEEITMIGGAPVEGTGGDPAVTIYQGEYSSNGTGTSPVSGKLVHVSLDETTGQYILVPIDYYEVIGSATEGGWGSGQELAQKSATAEKVEFEATNVVLRGGEFKIRYNGIWNIDLDAEDCDEATSPCLNFFTNFGGTVDELEAGGSNFAFTGEGAYTVTLSFTPGAGNNVALKLTRTGDAPEITFDPTEYAFGIIGDATAKGWDADRNMYYKGKVNEAHTWIGVVTLSATGKFKFRTNDDWAFNLGGVLAADGVSATLAKDGSDIASPGAGAYYIVLKTADEGSTWTATMTTDAWGIIGAATPTGWDSDTDMTADGFVDGVSTYSVTLAMTADKYKFRAGNSWDYNLGGDASALSADGGDLSITEAGTYKVVLSYDGTTYSTTATKQ